MSSINAQSGWEIALGAHLASATQAHRQVISSTTTPEDIVTILQRIQTKARAGKTNKLLDTIHRAATPLREFQTVADVIVQASPEIGCVSLATVVNVFV
jgi:hypothetical protein